MIKIASRIPVSEPDLSGNEKKYVNKALSSSWISSKGKCITEFENLFAQYIGVPYGIATSNGTAALHLSLVALGIGKGDEVLVPDLTFVASGNAVIYTGAKPILVDVEKDTGNIDPDRIEEKITKKTKVILVVHLLGHPADMNRILSIAKKHNLLIVEDAAEAHGAEIKISQLDKLPQSFKQDDRWRKVGSFGIVGCFSFYGNKIITTGEGGMVVTYDKNLMKKIKMLRDHGQDSNRRYYHSVIGFNYRLTNIQAALGLAQLERVEEFIKKKRAIARRYTQLFSSVSGIRTPIEKEWARSVFWMYAISVDKKFPKTRDQLMNFLTKKGVETRPFFIPLHELPMHPTSYSFPCTTSLSHSGLFLPSGVTLKEREIELVVSYIKKIHA